MAMMSLHWFLTNGHDVPTLVLNLWPRCPYIGSQLMAMMSLHWFSTNGQDVPTLVLNLWP